ncbi:hypothetical protein QM012_008533 [Aureobasidium pullulans]|uniref:Uncharacterized protein n=1 Tax=Aureobasidium pullulans TaxID=5580 RepID=A0ABR0TLA1_AURPU
MAKREDSQRIALAELLYLRRLQRYQKRKSDHIDHRLHWLEKSCEARDRMIRGAKDLQNELTESIYSGDRNRFSILFNTFHTFRDACNEWDNQSPVLENLSNYPPDQQTGSFLDRVSPDTRETLLTFLSRVSFDPLFLLDRLLELPDLAFAALSRPYSQTLTGISIFGDHLKNPSDRIEHETTKRLLDFSRSDVLCMLLRLIPMDEHTQNGPFSSAWGTICAGLLSYQKAGSDKFVITVMNAHLGQLDRTAHHNLDTWLLETIRDGDFLLYHADRRPFRNKGQPLPGVPNDDSKTVDDFFATAIEKLLLMLINNKLTKLIPSSVLSLAKSIVARLDPSSQQQQAAPYFLSQRAMVYYSRIMSLQLSDSEYYMNLLIVHDKLWRASPIHVESIVDLFRLSPLEAEFVPMASDPGSNILNSGGRYIRQITLCASEIVNAVHSLYPENFDLYSGLYVLRGSTLRSSASSISGLSLFRAMSPSEPTLPRNGRCDGIPEVSTPPGLSIPGMAPYGSSQTHGYPSAGDVFGHRLREACLELAAFTGSHHPEKGSCDLFSEHWTSLETYVSQDTISWLDYTSQNNDYDGLSMSFSMDQLVEPGTFDFLSTGINTLLDGFFSKTTSNTESATQDVHSLHSSLLAQLENARASCYHQGDFAKAHLFFRLAKATTSLSPETISQIVQAVAEEFRHSIDVSRLRVQKGEAQIEKLNDKTNSQQIEMQSISYINDRLREKMWYSADIQRAGHYEELRKVVTALRVMASTSRPKTDKKKPLLRHRSASKSLNQSMQLKTEAATLELLSAPAEKGGTNKLSDVQIDMTTRWMQARGVERVCRAEERIHRFCSELTRCIDHFVGQSIVDNPILWSSPLFQNQRPLSGQAHGRVGTPNSDPSALAKLRSMYDNNVVGSYEAHVPSQWTRFSNPSRTTMQPNFAARSISPKSIHHDYFGCRSPTLTHKSSGTLWSSFSAGPQSPSSATSFPSRALSPMSTGRPLSRHSCLQQNQASFLEELKQNLTSLLLSDFHDLFRSGSETDKAVRKILKLKLPTGLVPSEAMEPEHNSSQSSFNFDQVFSMLLKRFELQASPYAKLDILLELQSMLKAYRVDCGLEDVNSASQPNTSLSAQHRLSLRIDTSSTPRTALGHDSNILSFRQLFQDPYRRPKTLFRDLQYIASLVPLNILDSTPRGRAFWNATIAALDLKEEICQSMIETADQIIQYNTFNRGHSRVTSAAQAKRDAAAFSPPTPQPSDPSVADLTMSDAATLLQLTAKEGIPAAQRELATLYLTNPDLLGICLSPFSKVKEVFKDAEKDREAASDRYDPVAMAIAQHWMELSAKGGDGPAARYLRGKDEFDRIP